MNQNQKIPQNNSSVAWFKIASLIERKEREKALSVYKLMVHSLADRAYALQLEGDILWSFDDIYDACQRYLQSAFLYRNSKRWLNAASVYEHVCLLDPNNTEAMIHLIPCYAQLKWDDKFEQKLVSIVSFISQNRLDEKGVANSVKLLAESAREIDDASLKDQLHENVKQLLAKMPHGMAEKLEPVVKKYF